MLGGEFMGYICCFGTVYSDVHLGFLCTSDCENTALNLQDQLDYKLCHILRFFTLHSCLKMRKQLSVLLSVVCIYLIMGPITTQ